MEIIAFGHRRRVGKSTAADFLFSALKNMNPKIKVFKGGFADAVKEQAHSMFAWAGVHPAYYYENNPGSKEIKIPGLGWSARDIWIHVGEEMRKISPIMWVELLWEKIPADTDIAVIYDLRKLPEAEAVLSKGGTCHRILRDVEEFSDPVDSELRDFQKWASEIWNTGTKEDLMNRMRIMAENILSKGLL